MLGGILPTATYNTPPFDANGALSIQNGATFIRDSARNIVEQMVSKNEYLPDRFRQEINMVMSLTVDMVTVQSLVDSMLGTLFDVIKIADPTNSIRSVVDTRKKYICQPATHKLPNTNPARGTAITITQTITLDGTRPLVIASEAIPGSFFEKLRDLVVRVKAISADHPAHGIIYKHEDPRFKEVAAKSRKFLDQILVEFHESMVTQLEVLRAALDSGTKISGIINLLTYCAPGFLLPDTRVCGVMSRTHDERIREIISDSLSESMFCLDKTCDPMKVVNRWLELGERNTDNDGSRPGQRATVVVKSGAEQGVKVEMFLISPIDTFNKKLSQYCQDRQLEITMPISVVGIDWETHTSQHCFAAPNGSIVQKTKNATMEEFSDQNPPMVDPNAKVTTHTAPCLIYRGKVVPVICKDLEQSKEMNQLLMQTWSIDYAMTNNVIPALLNADRNYAVDMFHPANWLATNNLAKLLQSWQGCGPTTTVYSSGTQSKRSSINGNALARIMEECVMPIPAATISDHVLIEASENKTSTRHAVNDVLTSQSDGCFLHPHGTFIKHTGANTQQLAFVPCLTWQEMNYVSHVIVISNVLTLIKRNVNPTEDRPGIVARNRMKVWQKTKDQVAGGGLEPQTGNGSEDIDSSEYMEIFSSERGVKSNNRKRRFDADAYGSIIMDEVYLSEMEFRSLYRAAKVYSDAQTTQPQASEDVTPSEGFREFLELLKDGTSASEIYDNEQERLNNLSMKYDLVHEMCTSFANNNHATSKLILNQARIGVQSSDKSKAYDEINYQILLSMLNEHGGEDAMRKEVGYYWLVYLFTVSPYTKGLFQWLAKHDLFLGVGSILLRGESGLCENAVLARVGGMKSLFGVASVKDYNNGTGTATLGPDGGDVELTMEASLEVGFADNSFQIPGITMIAAHKISDDFSRVGTDVFVPSPTMVNAGWRKSDNRQFVAVLCPPIMDMNHMSDMFNPLGRNMMDTNTHAWGDLIPSSSTANIENFYPAVFGFRTHNPYGLRGGIALLSHLGAIRDGPQYKDPDLSVRRDGASHISARTKQIEIPLTNYVKSTDPPTANQAARMQSAKNRAEQTYSPFVESALIGRLVDCQTSLGNPTDKKTVANRLDTMFKNTDRLDLTQISSAFGCGTLCEFATSTQELEAHQSKMMSAKLATAQAYGPGEEMSTLEHIQRQRFYVDASRGFQIYCTGSAITRTYDQRVYMSNSYRTR